MAPPGSLAGEVSAWLTNAAQVRHLTREEAEQGWRVRLNGVVTFCDPNRHLFWIQDTTGGVFVSPESGLKGWKAGQKVQVTGVVAAGSHLPYVNQGMVEDLGLGLLPSPRTVTLGELSGDTEDGNWVEIRGVVRNALSREGMLLLEMVEGKHRLRVNVLDATLGGGPPRQWVDARVLARGVCGMVSIRSHESILLDLHVPSLMHLAVETPAPDRPFARAVRTIESLRADPAPPALAHRVRVRGRLGLAPNGAWQLIDHTGTILVQPLDSGLPSAAAGAEAEVLGFPGGEAQRPGIEDAVIYLLSRSWPEEAPGSAAAIGENLPVLTQVDEVRLLQLTEARRGFPVRLRGVLTCVDPDHNLAFVQEDTGGIRVHGPLAGFRGQAGQAVQVDGYTGGGKFAPVLREARFQILGSGLMPAPKSATLEQLESGDLDGLRVQIAGVVRYLTGSRRHLEIHLWTSGRTLRAFVPGFETNQLPGHWVDAEVLVRGVCSPDLDGGRQLTGLQLQVAGMADVVVTRPAPSDPFALPVKPIESLLQFQGRNELKHRVHVRGTVTFRDPRWCTVFVQDETRSIYVRALQEPKVSVGDQVDVAGFVAAELYGPVLTEAVLRRIGPGAPPSAREVSIARAVTGEYDAQLVTLDGLLVDRAAAATSGLVLQADGWTFLAVLESTQDGGDLGSLRVGSRLRLTGICSVEASGSYGATKLCLHLRTPADVTVLQRPPWWTTRHWALLLAVALAVLAATTGWVWLLRRSVREQTALVLETERRQRAILDNIPDPAWLKDRNGCYLAVNEAWCRIFGRSRAAALGRRGVDLLPMAVAEQSEREEAEVLRTRKPLHKDELLGDVEQVAHWYQTTIAPILNDQQEVVGTAGIARDISGRKQAEAALSRSEAQLAAIFDSTPIMMCLVNEQREIEHSNRTLQERSGPGAKTGRRLGDVLGCVQAAPGTGRCGQTVNCASCPLASAVMRTFQTGEPCRQVELSLQPPHPEGKREMTVLASTALVRLEGASRVLLCLEDITQRRQLEAQFLQAQKMEAIGQLAGGVAHDFNNILAAILINVGLLKQTPNLDCEIAEGLDDLEEQANRAANLTRQLLMFSRRQQMILRRLDLCEVVDGMVKMLHRLLGEHITIETPKAQTPLWVDADAGMLEQVLMNLCVNARDAMPKGGRLILSLDRVHVTPEMAQGQTDARVGSFACLRVIDTGEGMDPATLKRIFEPFFTTKGVGKGTGLGLATVYGIARQHQGWVEVESQPGRGTAFRVYLPAAEVGAKSESRPEPEPPPRGTETILLVEDDQYVRRLVRMTLSHLGYAVLEARTGKEALGLWDRHTGRIDLLFTDMVMPEGMTGIELANRLRRARPGLKVIVSSGYSAELAHDPTPPPPGIRFLAKPYQPNTLASAVRACLDEPSA